MTEQTHDITLNQQDGSFGGLPTDKDTVRAPPTADTHTYVEFLPPTEIHRRMTFDSSREDFSLNSAPYLFFHCEYHDSVPLKRRHCSEERKERLLLANTLPLCAVVIPLCGFALFFAARLHRRFTIARLRAKVIATTDRRSNARLWSGSEYTTYKDEACPI